ncbi:Uncharacterised protein [uncultured Clostridium sp.]|nr:Uncharacterised protein [uncultured Clostridium sp.]
MIIVIGIYIILSIIIPIIFKYCIFENPELSNLTNSEWAGFLGSYAGGILGGLGTLIAMWYTVKTSLNIQKENNDAMNIQLQSDIQRRDKESREKFANEIANHLGVYITDISKYYYANIELEKLEERKEHVAERLSEQEEEEHTFDIHFEILQSYVPMTSKNRVIPEKNRTERAYVDILHEERRIKEMAIRVKANEEYFIMQTLLKNIPTADNLCAELNEMQNRVRDENVELTEKWVEKEKDLLMWNYSEFRKTYIDKSEE